MRPFERRIFLGLTAAVLGFVPLIITMFIALRTVIKEQNDVIDIESEQVLQAERLRYIDSALSSIMPAYALSGDSKLVESFNDRSRQFEEEAARLALTENDPILRSRLLEIRALAARLRARAQPGIELRRKGATPLEVNEYFARYVADDSVILQKKLQELLQSEFRDLENAKQKLSRTVSWVVISLVGLAVAAIVLMVFMGRLVVKVLRQKRLYDEAQEKLLARERVLSQARREAVEVVSHDLKNPLGSIKMSVEMMLDDLSAEHVDVKSIREDLGIISRSADSMERLIRDLLDHAKIEAGQMILEKTPEDVAALTSDLVERLQPLAKRKSLQLLYSGPRAGLTIPLDAGRIEQVLSNLIGNSLKFTQEGGVIRVTAKASGAETVITVEDNGSGIEPEMLPHIFDRFWQVKETAKNGNGLGLAIAKSIIEAHGGRIQAESARGRGTRFSITLQKSAMPRAHETSKFTQPNPQMH